MDPADRPGGDVRDGRRHQVDPVDPVDPADLADYDAVFSEKLDLLLRLHEDDHVTWSGKFRPPLHHAPVTPRAVQQLLNNTFSKATTMFWLCKAAVTHMRPSASTINTSSIQAFEPSPELLDYACTKAAIVNFTEGLSADLVSRGNSVAPGPVWTPLIPATMPAEKVETFGGQTPLGRAAQPAELAPPYVFLASRSRVTSSVRCSE